MDPLALETMSMRKTDPAQKERKHAEAVAQQFETIFVRTLVSSLRQTGSVGGDDGGMFGSGPGADTYADWFDENLAEKVGASGHVGIKEALMRDFERTGEIRKQLETVAHAQRRAHDAIVDRTSLNAAMQAGKRGTNVLP